MRQIVDALACNSRQTYVVTMPVRRSMLQIISPVSRRKYSLQELLAMQGDEPLVIDQAWDSMPVSVREVSVSHSVSTNIWQHGDVTVQPVELVQTVSAANSRG
jgi:hypothetical protein